MIRPAQRIPFSQKDDTWVEQSARYFSSMMTYAIDHRQADILYRAANGELDESDYLYVTNPRSTDREKLKRFPSKIRNFDIISTNIMLLMGEKRRRGLDFTVVALNSNIEDERKELEGELVNQYLTQQLMQEVVMQQVQSGQQPNIQADQQLTAEAIKKKVSGLQDKLAIEGQMTLDYIREACDLDSKTVENFYHWLCTARAFDYAEPDGDEVCFNDISPKNFKYLANNRTRFLKDAQACEYFCRMPLTEVIDVFQGVKGFTEDIIKELESKMGYGMIEGFSTAGSGYSGFSDRDILSIRNSTSFDSLIHNLDVRWGENKIYSDAEGIFVQHIVWTSMCKRAQIEVPNIFGEPDKIWVDEDYIPQEGEKIDWQWKRQKWHCYLIDDKHVIGGSALEYTTEDVGSCDNPYNGRIFNLKHVNPMSIVEKGISYQIKYNIIHYYIEKTLAKNLGKLVVMPLSLIPENKDLDMEASMYYADAMSFLFADDSKKNFQAAINGIKVLDASLSQYINQLYEYLKIIKEEWDSLIGITPQRKGQMNASDGKSTTDNSVFRSSIMTEELFTQYEEYEETNLNRLLELGRIAFADGKKAMFIRGTKNEAALLNLDPTFSYNKYLVKAKNAGKNLQRLEAARQTAQALTQNKDGRYSDVLKVINSDNISDLLQEMENVEANFEAQQQAQQQAQEQQVQQAEQLKKDVAQINADASNYRADKIYDATIESARIKADTMLDLDKFNAPETAYQEIQVLEESSLKREELMKKHEIENKRIDAERERTTKDNETKKYVADKHLQAAKKSSQDN